MILNLLKLLTGKDNCKCEHEPKITIINILSSTGRQVVYKCKKCDSFVPNPYAEF